jgi:DNA repair photolyase
MTRQQWEASPFRVRRNLIRDLRNDAEQLRGTNERVLLCFFGDLYSPEAVKTGISRQILEVLREFDIPWQVLTKGGMRAVPDFDLYGPNDAFATTLTFTRNQDSVNLEPGAALPSDRCRAIQEAYDRGIKTWVSLEPVLNPEDALYWIDNSFPVVSLFKVGKLNHDAAREKEIDWRRFGMEVIARLESRGLRYYIKHDLAKHLAGVPYTNTDTRKVR